HFATPNPDIPFHDLNLEVAGRGAVLARNRSRRYAGVNNFGFGGTNAHVIIADAPSRTRAPSRTPAAGPHNFLMVTARSRAALAQLAAAYGHSIADGADLGEAINAAGWQREPLSERLVVCGSTSREFTAALQAFAAGAPADNAACDTALATEVGTVLVFSGNGAQWPGMGRSAFRRNPHFARTFRRFDDLFGRHAGWSLEAALFADDLASQLASTRVAQPLLFALQVSLASALRALGLRIDGVIGHSVGEVAAAWVAGALTCEQAVGVIYARSQYQELSRGSGKMAAVNLSEAAATALLHEAGIA